MKRIVSAAALTAGSLLAPSALALGLGEINVRSHLSQRFSASIPLNTDSADETANLRVSLAGADEYAQAGIERNLVLSSLRFSIKAEDQPRIEITSATPINEPFLQVLLEVRGGGQRLTRQYTVLLDPPESAKSQKAVPAPAKPVAEAPKPAAVAAPVPKPEAVAEAKPAAPSPAPAVTAKPVTPPEESFYETADEAARKPVDTEAVVAAAAADASEGALYGPVRTGETLWSIAVAMRPDSTVMVDQVLLALYKANPRAFESGLNSLLRGSMLRVPTLAEMTAVGPEAAQAEIARLRGERPRRSAPSTSRRQPRIEPALIAPPPPAAAASAAPPAVTTQPSATSPATAAAPAAAPADDQPAETAPGAIAAAAPVSGSADVVAPTSSDIAASVTEPATTDAAAAAPPETEPPAAPAPADADVVESAPLRTKPTEPVGIVEKLLLPMLAGLIAISGLLWLVGRIRARRARTPQAPVVNVPPPERSAESAARRLAGESPRTPAVPVAAAAATPASVVGTVVEGEAPVAAAGDSFASTPSTTPLLDLDGGDPLAEAEFNIAYGLHDEAIPLLRRAQAAHPQRTDIGVKLAKSLLAVGKREEFDDTVAALQTRLPADELRELMLLAGPASAVPNAVAAQPEPAPLPPAAAPIAAAEPGYPTPTDDGSPVEAAPEMPTPATAADAPLEFDLESFDLPPVESGVPAPAVVAESEGPGSVVEFDLSGFNLDPQPAASAAPTAAPEPMASVEFDLGTFEPTPTPPSAPAPAQAPAPSAPLGSMDIQLDDFDFGVEPEESPTISGDESGTKLDLARAYVEMGDNEMARGLLNEVVRQGDDAQRADARTLLDRLG